MSLEDHLVNLRLASKQMVRASKKAEGSEKEAKNKLKKAIEARNTEGARIYAQVSEAGRGPMRRNMERAWAGFQKFEALQAGPPPGLLASWRISLPYATLHACYA